MSARSASLVCIAAFAVLAGCSGAPATHDPSATHSALAPTASTAAPGVADVLLPQFVKLVKGAVEAVPVLQNTGYQATVGGTTPLPCPAGQVRDYVVQTYLYAATDLKHTNPAPQVETVLKADGLTFGPWTGTVSGPSTDMTATSMTTNATVLIHYTPRQLQVIAKLSCLPGQRLPVAHRM